MHFEWAAIKCQGLARETSRGRDKTSLDTSPGGGGTGTGTRVLGHRQGQLWWERAAMTPRAADAPMLGSESPVVPRIPEKEEEEDGGCCGRRQRAAPEKGERHMKGPVPLTPTAPRRSPRLAEQRQRLLSSGPIKRWVALEGGPDKYKGIRQVKGVSGGVKGRRMLSENH